MQILKAGVLYFVLVFGAGFVLGFIRILWVVPKFGTRIAELMETPIMLIVTILAARWVARRLAVPPAPSRRLAVGLVALSLLLLAEFIMVVLSVPRLTIGEYLASRDPVAGTVYVVMLGVFTVMPIFVAKPWAKLVDALVGLLAWVWGLPPHPTKKDFIARLKLTPEVRFTYVKPEPQRQWIVRRAGWITFLIVALGGLLSWLLDLGLWVTAIFVVVSLLLFRILAWFTLEIVPLAHASALKKALCRCYWGLLALVGLVVVPLGLFGLVVKVCQRIWYSPNPFSKSLPYLLALLSILYMLVVIYKQTYVLKLKPWLLIGFSLGVIPIGLVWGGLSLYWAKYSPEDIFHQKVVKLRPPFVTRNSSGDVISGVQKQGRIALALSGGGYRAAVIHAGLLAALEEQKVTVDILTAVSGGTIIAAAYAKGVEPNTFYEALKCNQPGLPGHIWSIQSVIKDVFLRGDGFTATYSDNFRRVFFSDTTLGDLPDKPLLIANVTDMEIGRLNPREILYKENNGPTLLADVVAASAAFPGPFQPKSLDWPCNNPAQSHCKSKKRRFSDGGALENLGLEGLRLYLSQSPKAILPAVLIISDASSQADPKELQPKVDLVSLFGNVYDLSSGLAHSLLYDRFTGSQDLCRCMNPNPVKENALCKVEEKGLCKVNYKVLFKYNGTQELITIVIRPTDEDLMKWLGDASEGYKDGNGSTLKSVQNDVKGFSTLRELKQEEVEKAFWLGKTLGTIYMPAIKKAIAISNVPPA